MPAVSSVTVPADTVHTVAVVEAKFTASPEEAVAVSEKGAVPMTTFGRAAKVTVWLAGGGVKPGFALGATDEFGHQAVQDKVHMHDLHATILRLLGLDHEKLTYRYAGRDFRLTDVHGKVVTEVMA